MKRSVKRGRGHGRARALLGLLALAAVAGGGAAWHLSAEGYYFRNLKPSDWILHWRGVYRYDAAHHTVRQGSAKVPMVALTFDDGPHPTTPALLDALKAGGAHGTFFLVGSNVLKAPALARRIVAEGNEVANHTRTHLRLPPLRDDQIRREILDNVIVIARVTGKRVRLFRPPGGQYDDRVTAEAAREGMTTVLWSNNTGDWRTKAPRWVVNRVLSTVQPGDIVLLHEDHPETAAAIPAILAGLRARGLRPVTVSELLKASGVAKRSDSGDDPREVTARRKLSPCGRESGIRTPESELSSPV